MRAVLMRISFTLVALASTRLTDFVITRNVKAVQDGTTPRFIPIVYKIPEHGILQDPASMRVAAGFSPYYSIIL